MLLAVAILLGSATAVLRIPDLAAARDLLGGAYATQAAALAVVSVIVWVVILLSAGVLVVNAIRATVGQAMSRRRRWARALLVAACGLVLLAGGAYRHSAAGYSICCGSVQEARQLVR